MDNHHFDFEEEVNSELQKEIELSNEKDKLKETVKLINKEILNYIDKRKYISDYILDYRKSVIDEYRDDEDKIVEYFDHERFVKEEAFRTIDKRLKELLILVSAPYFGKVNFIEEDIGEAESLYVGRFGMTPEGAYEPVVVDWRAPIAALFYAGKLGKTVYRAPMGDIDAEILQKRQFIIKKAKLLGMFDSSVEVKDEILQMVLSANTSDKLKDIIMTIQEEQDNLIRQPRDKTIIVNGVAGSGKTTIALHRVAYLLYNYRESMQDKVLILGPNSIFMEYISTVLPSLGEVGVKQHTFRDFAMELLNVQNIMEFKDYIEKILSGDGDFIQDVLYKNSEGYISELDSKIEELDKEYFRTQDVSFHGKIVVAKDEIDEMFNKHYSSMALFRRSKRIRRVIFSRIKDERDNIIRRIQKEHNEYIGSLSKAQCELEGNNLEFNRRMKIKEVIREVLNAKEALKWLDNPDVISIYNRLNGGRELTVDDLAPMLYLKIKLEGIKLKNEIKHVVIDEAQDYSLIQFRVIKELTKAISFTIVGDANQRILPIQGEVPMLKLQDIFTDLSVEYFPLEKSYRSTMEIMEYANQFLEEGKIIPLVRKGEPVVSKKFESKGQVAAEIEDTIKKLKEKGHESIAVVFRELEEVNRFAELLKQKEFIKVIDREDIIYTGGTVFIPSYFAKGLEFDAVIIVHKKELAFVQNEEPNIAEHGTSDNKLRYVMCTRALHELYDFSY
jgi:DNA helicase II / ATP-dependent DNA helicase PcrA